MVANAKQTGDHAVCFFQAQKSPLTICLRAFVFVMEYLPDRKISEIILGKALTAEQTG